jgi:HSP20 family protein
MDDSDDPFDEFFSEIERMMGGDGFGDDAHVDLRETDEELVVLADLPGVEKDALTLRCDGDTLTVRVSTNAREFEERIRLPTGVDEESATASFNNGVLEVRLQKVDRGSDINLQ